MRVSYEDIRPDTDSSFRLLLTPRLEDVFLWHYHPEFEIVYIEGASGTRHVGQHLSRYEGSDLVFIGPNIPHLNFDYGVRTAHEKVVVQMKEDFLGKDFLQRPELGDIRRLFDQARHGLAFNGESKRVVGERLKRLSGLGHFAQLLELLQIFQLMAQAEEATLLHAKPIAHGYNLKEQQRLKKLDRFIEENYRRKLEMQEVAELTHLTPAAFCRYFRKMTRLTFTDYVNQYRIVEAKKLLLLGHNVTEACYASGFQNLSYFNKTFKKITGDNPLQFKRRHLNA
jgi:AraC-like DNA-binding protein